ncbi:DeoR/GlpR family DNA-binding transcription regulator [Thaumasiovibrio sp. DFM-14]|uniref:DeoR/GlpR family DNA-binding transcription regulator n=1 Tax=Thaumasiovibrio sp. DFM-14 TaxID=3384792 RepID=UPI0039A38BAF
MAPILRKKEIINVLSERGMLSVGELAAHLDVSEMTIRRDITKLEEENLVIKHQGIIELIDSNHPNKLTYEPPRIQKETLFHDEKVYVASMAVKEVSDGMILYLDAGTTTLEIAKQLAFEYGFNDLTIITNDFAITMLLIQHSTYTIYHTGGRVDRENQSCVGEQTANALAGLHITKAFISSSSWDSNGITTPNESKIAVKRAIINSSRQRYLVTDSSKYNTAAMFKICDLSVFDKIFTDQNIPDTAVDDIQLQGVKIFK